MINHKVKCANFEIANDQPFTLIAGPCQLEDEAHAIKMSSELKKITNELGINLIYKTSFDKANRTSLKGKRGMGLEKSLPIFDRIRKEIGLPVLTDVHTIEHCSAVCTSVKTGIPTSFLILSKIGRDFSKPIPLFPLRLVLLALSKEVL